MAACDPGLHYDKWKPRISNWQLSINNPPPVWHLRSRTGVTFSSENHRSQRKETLVEGHEKSFLSNLAARLRQTALMKAPMSHQTSLSKSWSKQMRYKGNFSARTAENKVGAMWHGQRSDSQHAEQMNATVRGSTPNGCRTFKKKVRVFKVTRLRVNSIHRSWTGSNVRKLSAAVFQDGWCPGNEPTADIGVAAEEPVCTERLADCDQRCRHHLVEVTECVQPPDNRAQQCGRW